MTDENYADASYDTRRTETPRSRGRQAERRSRDRTDGGRPVADRATDGRSTDDRRVGEATTSDRPSMGDVSHTNPYTGESFGNTVAYRRGSTVVVDGGEADAVPEADGAEADGADEADADEEPSEEERKTMKDISHKPPHDAPDPNAVYMRGGEGGTEETEE